MPQPVKNDCCHAQTHQFDSEEDKAFDGVPFLESMFPHEIYGIRDKLRDEEHEQKSSQIFPWTSFSTCERNKERIGKKQDSPHKTLYCKMHPHP